jgi:hypothetical protein
LLNPLGKPALLDIVVKEVSLSFFFSVNGSLGKNAFSLLFIFLLSVSSSECKTSYQEVCTHLAGKELFGPGSCEDLL